MSSEDFKPILIEDARIAHMKDEIPFAVLSGPQENTFQQFPSNTSSSDTSIIFNVQVPSMSTAIYRNFEISTTIAITLNMTNVPENALAMNYGYTDSLNAFPLNALFVNSTISLSQWW
jgi:hypothetical protein